MSIGLYDGLEITQSDINVTQYGWTAGDIEGVTQILDYVKQVQIMYEQTVKLEISVRELLGQLDVLKGMSDSIKIMYDDFLLKYPQLQETLDIVNQKLVEIEGLAQNVEDNTVKVVDLHSKVVLLKNEIDTIYESIQNILSQVTTLQQEVEADKLHVDGVLVQVTALYNECERLANELRQGQVYRGTWNPNTQAWPPHLGTNSVWDVVLNEGQIEFVWSGIKWLWGDRLLYIVATTSYEQVESGTGVFSVNSKTGYVTLDAADVGALATTWVPDWSIITNKPQYATRWPTPAEIGAITVNDVPPADLLIPRDKQDEITVPNMLPTGVTFDLKKNVTDGLSVGGGTFHSVLNLKVWPDSSKSQAHQLGFGDNGQVAIRTSSPNYSSWTNWEKFFTTINKPSVSDIVGLQDALDKSGGSPVLSTAWVSLRSSMWNGYVAADGQVLNRADYPDAWAAVQAGKVPVVPDADWLADPTKRGAFTAGNGTTTFRIPDYNGKSSGSLGAAFLRGDGLNSAGTNGSVQGDAIRNITGSIETSNPLVEWGGVNTGNGLLTLEKTKELGASAFTSTVNGYNKLNFDSSKSVPTAADNHPVNITGCWAVKLFGVVQNPGAIDGATLATQIATLQSTKYGPGINAKEEITTPYGAEKFPYVARSVIRSVPSWYPASNILRFLDFSDLMNAATAGKSRVVDYNWLSKFSFKIMLTIHSPVASIWKQVYSFDVDACVDSNGNNDLINPYNHTFTCHARLDRRGTIIQRLVPNSENNGVPYWECHFPAGTDLPSAVDKEVNLTVVALRMWD